MKALIVYGTRYGTTEEIAEEIGRVMEDERVEVDVINSKGLKNYEVSPYDLVAVGSGIKMGKWTKESLKFLRDNKSLLANKKVALFVSCGFANIKEKRAEAQEKYLDQVALEHLSGDPVATGLFGAVYDPNAKHGLMYKLVTKFVIEKELKKQGKEIGKRLDDRNWDEIRAWGRDLADLDV